MNRTTALLARVVLAGVIAMSTQGAFAEEDAPAPAEAPEPQTSSPGEEQAAGDQTAPTSEGEQPAPAPAPEPEPARTAPPDVEPDPSEAHYVFGASRLQTGDLIGAIEEFREALRVRSDLVQARVGLGTAFYQLGDLDSAIEASRAAVRLQPDLVQAHLNLATALMVKRDWTGAREELQTVLRLQPDLVQAHYNLGVVLYTMGDRHGAIGAYRQALGLKPDFADAHFNLGLLLKMTNQETEAAREFYAAALAGLPKAEYFLGNAYATGRGAERNLALAIQLWFRAAYQDVSQAKEALTQLRHTALLKARQSPEESRAILQAFADFRKELWREFPDLAPESDDDSVGAALLRKGRVPEAIPVLIQEALALSEPAQAQLETLYEQGLEGHLAPHDGRILTYFRRAAEEGLPKPRLALARLYVQGLGVPRDLAKARTLLKGNPDEDAKALMRELSAIQSNGQPAKRNSKPESKSP